MLEELDIQNLGPIRHVTVTPSPGMTAITGETGAGKSMLLNAIRLISGGAANSDAVSAGSDGTLAQAVFDVTGNIAAQEIARDAGVEPEDGELFVTRTVPAAGRSRAVLGGHSVPRSVLAGLSQELIVIHGQADQLRIAAPARQRDFLDAYAGDEVQLDAYREAWDAYTAARDKLESVGSQQVEARQRADYLRESIARIDDVSPQSGEYEELRDRRDRLEHSAEIARGIGMALAVLDPSQADSDSSGARDALRQAVDALRSVRGVNVFDDIIERLESCASEVDDIVYQLSDMVDDDDEDASLDALNGRIHDLDELMRRWGPTLDDVLKWRQKAQFELEDLDDSPERLRQLKAERDRRLAEAKTAAASLSKVRQKAAERLESQVNGELSALAMPDAGFFVSVSPREARSGAGRQGARQPGVQRSGSERSVAAVEPLDAHGGDDVEFLFTPFPGAGRLPLGKSASGGELSRLMLSMELAAADARARRGQGSGGAGGAAGGATDGGDGGRHDSAEGSAAQQALPTFVFDEVDAGVGGKSAAELGRRLARLAQGAQVIVVTHLAQVASWASAQFVVAKAKDSDGAVHTGVTQVSGEDRVREIARMLSGSESDASLRHAAELLRECGN